MIHRKASLFRMELTLISKFQLNPFVPEVSLAVASCVLTPKNTAYKLGLLKSTLQLLTVKSILNESKTEQI